MREGWQQKRRMAPQLVEIAEDWGWRAGGGISKERLMCFGFSVRRQHTKKAQFANVILFAAWHNLAKARVI